MNEKALIEALEDKQLKTLLLARLLLAINQDEYCSPEVDEATNAILDYVGL